MGLFGMAACLCGGCLGPVVGQAAASPIKDLPAALCAGVVLYYTMRLLAGDLRFSWPHRIGFGAALAFTGLFRHNGFVLVLAAGLWLLARGIYCRQKGLLATVAVCAACIFAVDGVAAPLLEDSQGVNDVFNNLFILAAGQNPKEILQLYLELFL